MADAIALALAGRLPSTVPSAAWAPVAALPAARSLGATSTDGSRIYITHGNIAGSLYSDGSVIVPGGGVSALPSAQYAKAYVAGTYAAGRHWSIGGLDTAAGAVRTVEAYAPAGTNGASGTWATSTILPAVRCAAAAATVGTFVYVAGGTTNTSSSTPAANGAAASVYRYDASTLGGAWQTLPDLPAARYGGAMVAVGTRLYYLGGRDSAGSSSAAVYVYDTVAASWSTGVSLPGAAGEPAAAAVSSGTIYLYTGANATTANTVYVLAPGATAWTTSTAPTTAHGSSAGAAAIGTTLYLVSGTTTNVDALDPTASGYASKVQALQQYLASIDPAAYAAARKLPVSLTALTPSWSANTAELGALSDSGYATDAQGRTYVVQGRNASGQVQNTYRRDPLTGTWATLASTFPNGIPAAAMTNRVVVDSQGRLWAWVGGASASSTNYLHLFTPATNTWTTAYTGTSSANYAQNASLGIDSQDRLYLFAGLSVGSISSSRYTPSLGTWETLAAEPSNPSRYDVSVTYDAATGSFQAIGGAQVVNSTNVTDARVTRYNVASNTWTTRSALPAARHQPAVAVDLRGRVYVMAGYAGNPYQNNTATTYRYTVLTDTWETLASSAVSRGGPAGGRDNLGRLLLIGGQNGNVSSPVYLTGTETLTPEATYDPRPVKALAALTA